MILHVLPHLRRRLGLTKKLHTPDDKVIQVVDLMFDRLRQTWENFSEEDMAFMSAEMAFRGFSYASHIAGNSKKRKAIIPLKLVMEESSESSEEELPKRHVAADVGGDDDEDEDEAEVEGEEEEEEEGGGGG